MPSESSMPLTDSSTSFRSDGESLSPSRVASRMAIAISVIRPWEMRFIFIALLSSRFTTWVCMVLMSLEGKREATMGMPLVGAGLDRI
jgi:hypothetical protein